MSEISRLSSDTLLASCTRNKTYNYDNDTTEISEDDFEEMLADYVPPKPPPGVMLYTEEMQSAIEVLEDMQLGQLIRIIIDRAVNGCLSEESIELLHDDGKLNAIYTMIMPKVRKAQFEYNRKSLKSVLHSKGISIRK